MSQPDPDSVPQEAIDSEARTLLKRPDLLTYFQETIERRGCVGEAHSKTLLYLIYTSRKLEAPINTIVKGGSASGKSNLVISVGEFFPKDEVIDLSAMSTKALFHYKEPLKHKVLLVMEHAGVEAAAYALRTLQSEGRLEYLVTMGDPSTGFTSERVSVEGPVCFIVTTTLPQLDDQNESRCFTLHADDSEEQTKRIHESQRTKYLGERILDASQIAVWRRAQQLLQSRPVLIPYAHLIEFPIKPLRVRRDHPRFLALIEASAFLHQYQRATRTVGEVECIVASLEDYRVAYDLSVKILPGLIEALSPGAEQVIEKAQEHFKDVQFTLKQLKEKLGWDRKTVSKRVNEAIVAGHIKIDSSSVGTSTCYRLDGESGYQKNRSLLLTPDALQGKLQETGNLGNLSTPEEVPHG